MVVEFQGLRSEPLKIDVADAAPGLFQASQGVAAALNQDGSVNTEQNGANGGEVVVLYATGEGLTDPAAVTGNLSTMPFDQLPRPKLPVTVTIDGQAAEVQYAGAAPTMPAGVMQVNVVLPANLPQGKAVPVILKVGGRESAKASIFVR